MTNNKDVVIELGDIDEGAVGKWPPLLVKITWAVLVVGAVVGYAVFLLVDGATGENVGALIWALSFAASIASMSIRQTILAERL